jgi:hypothetical protein
MDVEGADGNQEKGVTYTPMMDCFWGGSLLMIATGDGRRKDWEEMGWQEDGEEKFEDENRREKVFVVVGKGLARKQRQLKNGAGPPGE